MIRRRLNTINFLLRVLTLLLPLMAFAMAAYIRFFSGLIPLFSPDIDMPDYFGLLLLTTIVWAVVVDHFGLFQFGHLSAQGAAIKSVFWACTVTYLAVVGATFFYRSTNFSRLFVAISAAAFFLLAAISGKIFRWVLDHTRNGPGVRARILIIGANDYAVKTARFILGTMLTPYVITAFVRLAGQESSPEASRVVDLSEVNEIFLTEELDDIIIAVPASCFSEISAIMKRLRNVCIPVRVVLDLGEDVSVGDMLFNFGGLRLLDLRASPSESVVYTFAKRSFDMAFSALALVMLAPAMVVIAIVIRLTSAGSAFFVQERVGLNGRLFKMYKFRTMSDGNRGESNTRWTTENDPRRTRFGTFLRRTNLDELPQFVNVLKGEMSIVGPRPERPHFVQKFLEEVAQYNTRHYLKVGMTGWAQVNGWRGDTSIQRRLEHDLYYLNNWSFVFDLKIIMMTIIRTFAANRNAY
ncbi:MAG TPA: exopolysaccharide biosynthesis polyprenyl glycosylphosphotransferase [Terriglobia bacterium]|nr:exopolysaccharide biosynthesis polyprenyl glycosylphosphotransferase [Terriglobia bacterium]